ncbi:MAG: HU family DNA-binding protein [Acidimicrobiia bacterium]
MNKAELIDKIAEGSGLDKRQADSALQAVLDTIKAAVAADDTVALPGFGKFSRSERKAREGRNPRTGEPVHIPASKAVKFSVAADFKKKVNSSNDATI